ncbi:MAG: tyrosine-type recombinase/integrase [Fermentimonas sp.]|nr:tyrosine-type recombinase/integrase [Fermentimonas sp.]
MQNVDRARMAREKSHNSLGGIPLNLPDLHVHDLRYANASLLINAGVPVKFISEHLGHSNTKTTEDIYAHVYNATAEKVASAISQALDGVM